MSPTIVTGRSAASITREVMPRLTSEVIARVRRGRYRRAGDDRCPHPVGQLLREWRERRRLSQLELSIQADISTRHLSFVETGRSRPTPEMILRLTEQLEVPLRERNQLLLAGGYAPAYPQHGLDEPELASVRAALRQVLRGHEPYPAVVINRWWDLVDGNAALGALIAGCAPELLEPPVNVLRLSLHPDGLAPRIVNLGPVARAPARAVAPARAADRRRPPGRARGRAAQLPGRRPDERRHRPASCCRCGCGVGDRELVAVQHRGARRHRHRRHRRGAVDRDVLPGRRSDRRRLRGTVACSDRRRP